MTEGFGPKVKGFDHFTFGDHKALKKKITKKFVQMTDELILQDRRSNDYFIIKNQPFPFEDELNYR